MEKSEAHGRISRPAFPRNRWPQARPFSDTPRRAGVARQASGRALCARRDLHALWWSARRRAGGGRHRSVSLAPRLLRPADRCAGSRPRPEPDSLLRRRVSDGRVRVGGRRGGPVSIRRPSSLRTIAIIGAGAAGESAAETLRREGYDGDILVYGADESPPVDRPNLSKDFLAGTAPEEWIPLRPPAFFGEQKIALALGSARDRHRCGGETTHAAGRTRGGLGCPLARHRCGCRSARHSRRGARARLHPSYPLRLPRHHRPGLPRPAGRSGGGELHRHGGDGLLAGAGSRSTRGRSRGAAVRAHPRGPSWAPFSGASTRSTASVSISAANRGRHWRRRGDAGQW